MANPMLMRALDEVRRFLMPSRGIIMWSGTAADIPTGWALCDGTGGTPDLTDRFILGAGKTYQPGANGGAATATPSVAAGNAQTGIGPRYRRTRRDCRKRQGGHSHLELRTEHLDRSSRDRDRYSGFDVGWKYLGMAQPCRQISSTCP